MCEENKTDIKRKRIINQLKNSIRNDNLVLFVGAGISTNSGLPTWNELIQKFKDELHLEDEENDYLKIAQYYWDEFDRNQYYQKLNEILDENQLKPNKLHELIIDINPKHIITTNYDTLLEKQIEKGITKYNVIAQDSDIPYTPSEKYLIKMHGDLKHKNVVLKEDDYTDYDKNFPMISTLIKYLLMNHTFLFVGYSLNDSTFNLIQRVVRSTFKEDTKKLYLFTPEQVSDIKIKYYSKKGIEVISSPSRGDMSKKTEVFLEELKLSNNNNVIDGESLENNIGFLTSLSYVQLSDMKDYFNNKTMSKLEYDLDSNFELNSRLETFFKEKTMVHRVMNYTFNKHNFQSNSKLKEAYDYYLKGQYNISQDKFKEVSEKAYNEKDYFTYLLAEFNFKNIYTWNDGDKNKKTNVELKEISDRMIESLSGNNKKIIQYFRENILNFNFIKDASLKINSYFDKIRFENINFQRGGHNFNGYLNEVRILMKDLDNFITYNCICVQQLRPYQELLNRYLEILLLSFENYLNSKKKSNNEFAHTSSVIKELDIDDIRIILKGIEKDNFSIVMKKYNYLEVSKEAKDYLFNEIKELLDSQDINENETYNKAHRNISLLPYLKYSEKDIEELLRIFKNIEANHRNIYDIRSMLKVIQINDELFNEKETKEELRQVLNCWINSKDILIIEYNIIQIKDVLRKIYKSEEGVLKIDNLELILSRIENNNARLDNEFKNLNYLPHIYDFLSEDIKSRIQKEFQNYEKQSVGEINFNFVSDIMLSGIYRFSEFEEELYKYYVDSKSELSIIRVFNLYNMGYFTNKDLKNDMTIVKPGVNLEVDWIWFKDYSEENISKMLEKYSYQVIKKDYAKDENVLAKVNDFIIKRFEQNER